MRLAAALVCVGLLAACGDDGSEGLSSRRDRNTRDMIEAKMQREIAQQVAKKQQLELERRQRTIELAKVKLDLLYKEVTDVEHALLEATDENEREAQLMKLEQLRVYLEEVKADLEAAKRGNKPKCDPDDPLC
jgi:hypothetical protein